MGCVYRIYCTVNQREYIGKTARSLAQRMIQHRHRSKESPLPLYTAIRKYGWGAFVIEELLSSSNELFLLKKEQEYIELRNTFYPAGYNMTLGGEGTIGTIHSEQWRRGNKKRAQLSGKPVYCLETNTTYPTVADAAKATNAVPMTVSGICRRPDHKSKKLHYCFDTPKDRAELQHLVSTGELYELPVTWTSGAANGSARKVYCVELDKTFGTMKEAVAYIGLPGKANGLVACCKGKNKTAYGYHWRYADDSSPVNVDIPQGV